MNEFTPSNSTGVVNGLMHQGLTWQVFRFGRLETTHKCIFRLLMSEMQYIVYSLIYSNVSTLHLSTLNFPHSNTEPSTHILLTIGFWYTHTFGIRIHFQHVDVKIHIYAKLFLFLICFSYFKHVESSNEEKFMQF